MRDGRVSDRGRGGVGREAICPYCFDSRKLPADDLLDGAEIGGATPLLAWMGDGATVFSY